MSYTKPFLGIYSFAGHRVGKLIVRDGTYTDLFTSIWYLDVTSYLPKIIVENKVFNSTYDK